MVVKTLMELCSAFVCHLLVFDWMRGLPSWLEALLFTSVAIVVSAILFRRSPTGKDSSPGLTLGFQMQIGRLRLVLAFGRNARSPVNRLKGE
jgi:hypothetical protein